MQVKANPAPTFPVPVSAPPASLADGSVLMTADEFRPSRFNSAKVCLWCGTRYCASGECERKHAASVWAPCPECNGFNFSACPGACMYGVVEVSRADDVYVLPMVQDEEEMFVPAELPTPAAPVYTVADLADLRYGLLAVALAASDMPARGEISDDEARLYAVQGLNRLGLAEVQARDITSRRIALACDGRNKDLRANAEYMAIWGSLTREDRANDKAYGLRFGRNQYAA